MEVPPTQQQQQQQQQPVTTTATPTTTTTATATPPHCPGFLERVGDLVEGKISWQEFLVTEVSQQQQQLRNFNKNMTVFLLHH